MQVISSSAEPLGIPPKQAWITIGCSNSTGYALLEAGELDSYTIGRARRITVESIQRYIQRRLEIARSPAARSALTPKRRGRSGKHSRAEAQT